MYNNDNNNNYNSNNNDNNNNYNSIIIIVILIIIKMIMIIVITIMIVIILIGMRKTNLKRESLEFQSKFLVNVFAAKAVRRSKTSVLKNITIIISKTRYKL